MRHAVINSELIAVAFITAIVFIYLNYKRGRGQFWKTLANTLSWATLIVFILFLTNLPLLIITYQSTIMKALSSEYSVTLAASFGVCFFWLRCRRPLLYGLLEICSSILAICYAVAIESSTLMPKLLGVLGGVYILVRGMDNVDKRLKDKNQGWTRVFWGKSDRKTVDP